MLTSQILVALLTTAGIVESRKGERGLESWLSLLNKERAREEWLWTIRRVRDWRVLKYSETKIIKYRLPPKAASGRVTSLSC
jgi:hypothetical protein